MKKSLLFLPLLGLASNVAAQELRGVVTDADNNPLVGASVYWAETTIGASTSATGAYTVHRVKNYDRLVASYLGYVNDTIRIADGVAEQNFRLRSEGVDIEGVVVESTLGGNYVKRDGILKGETKKIPYFELEIPVTAEGAHAEILDPRNTYKDPAEWDKRAKALAAKFIENFKKFSATNEECKRLEKFGPHLD